MKNSLITHSEGRTLRGDTIFYDKSRGLGEAFHNVVVTDTAKSIILSGHYGYFSDKNDQSLITDSALMREYSQSDTIYAHADTIYAYQLPDSSKVVNMYHNGRLYCVDFQAISDSLSYTSSDSVIHLRQMPVLWNENWQITGDSINIYPTNGELNRAHVIENAMIIQNHDTIHYNQMAGREFLAFIGNEQLDSLHIMGNARSIFFPEDKGQLIGLNKIESSYMTIYFNDGKLDRLKVFPQPVASMIPMAMITGDMLRLPNFTWQIDARPTSPADVFRHPQRISQAEITRQNEVIKEKQKEERRRSRKGRQEGVDEANPTTANGNGAAAKPMSASSAASAAKQRTD